MSSLLNIENLVGGYTQKNVLHGISFDVRPNEIVGLIGLNGAGKSTAIKHVIGLMEPKKGSISINGKTFQENPETYRKQFSYIPEMPVLYEELTLYEHLRLTAMAYDIPEDVFEKRMEPLLKEFRLEKKLKWFPVHFSKGMRQKVLIISSLLHNPDLIFLDEPLSGLDANSVMVIKDMLEALANQGKTIFYSSHIMDVVEKISNRIVLLVNGQIAADGSFDDLKEQSKAGSLESIFNQLTGFDEHKETAEKIVSIVTGDGQDE